MGVSQLQSVTPVLGVQLMASCRKSAHLLFSPQKPQDLWARTKGGFFQASPSLRGTQGQRDADRAQCPGLTSLQARSLHPKNSPSHPAWTQGHRACPSTTVSKWVPGRAGGPICPPTCRGRARNSSTRRAKPSASLCSSITQLLLPLKGHQETWRNRRKTEAVKAPAMATATSLGHGLQTSESKAWHSPRNSLTEKCPPHPSHPGRGPETPHGQER